MHKGCGCEGVVCMRGGGALPTVLILMQPPMETSDFLARSAWGIDLDRGTNGHVELAAAERVSGWVGGGEGPACSRGGVGCDEE